MFDTETTRLIQSAIHLDGLDLQRLPQDLTEAYALVVAARLEAVSNIAGDVPAEWQSTILRLRRLAETYEGVALFLPRNHGQRPACTFVAGSAHFTLSQARRVHARRTANAPIQPSLSPHAVGPEIAATLLFLIGGYQADAAETAKAFIPTGVNLLADQLMNFIAALASWSGTALREIADAPLVAPPQADADYFDAAANVMWRDLARSESV